MLKIVIAPEVLRQRRQERKVPCVRGKRREKEKQDCIERLTKPRTGIIWAPRLQWDPSNECTLRNRLSILLHHGCGADFKFTPSPTSASAFVLVVDLLSETLTVGGEDARWLGGGEEYTELGDARPDSGSRPRLK